MNRRSDTFIAAVRPIIEMLEGRQLMAVDLAVAGTGPTLLRSHVATRSITPPSVTAVRPGDGATNVRRDGFVACDLSLPNGGIDPATLLGNVTLIRVKDGAAVPGNADTSGGGDAIVLTPKMLLDPNTQYRFNITTGVQDVAGVPVTAFTASFTTGTLGGPVNSAIAFTQKVQANAQGKPFTGLTVGPDAKLYGATYTGEIYRWTVGADGTLGVPQIITTVNTANGATRTITGIVFDPKSTAANLILWVTHTENADLNGTDFTGKISRLSGTNLGVYQDYVTNLPRSVRDHLTNQAIFGPDGAMYVSQAASNAMGAPDLSWGNRPEHLLTAAILRVDLGAIATRITGGQGPLNVKTVDVGGTYNPYTAGVPLTLYATGVRNAYDLVWASNGFLYAATNGSAAGGNTPASSNSGLRPPTGTAYTGPAVPGITAVGVTEHDWLFKIVKGGYYGHPNPSRGQFVFNGGNPTSGVDPQEIKQYPVGTLPDVNWKPAAYDFGQNYSPDGTIEYKSNTFGGALKGKLLIVRYSGGDDIIVLSPNANGTIDPTKTMTGLAGTTGFADPVDLIEYRNPANASDPRNGMIYVAEYRGQRVTLLSPASAPPPMNDPGGPGVGGPATVVAVTGSSIQLSRGALAFNAVRGQSSGIVRLTITNKGSTALDINGLSIGGTEGSNFQITGNGGLPGSIAAGAAVTVTLVYNAPAGTTVGIHTGTLTIDSSDASKPSIVVNLRGLATIGTGGQNEPSLQRLFDLYQLGINTGDANPGDTNLFTPTAPLKANDEVFVQKLVRATPANVSVQVLGSFAGGTPAVRFGWYGAGSPGTKAELLTVNTGDSQSVAVNPVGVSSFDPGTTPFGIYATFPIFNNTAYSEDALNTGEGTAANRRKVRFYALRDGNGAVIPNAFVFTSEDFVNDKTGAYDTQDFFGIIRNAKVATVTSGNGLVVQNLDGAPFDDRVTFNRIGVQPPADLIDAATGLPYTPPPNVVHDTAQVQVTNGRGTPITITSLSLSNSSVWTIVSGPASGTVLQPGQSAIVTIKFVATKAPVTTLNETIDPSGRARSGNGTYSGSLTIGTNDATTPNTLVELRGYFQAKNEQDQEPNLPTLVNKIFGYATQVMKPGEVLNQGGIVKAVGEEVLSPFWLQADATQSVSVRQLAAYHTQGNTGTLNWFGKTSGVVKPLIVHSGVDAQSILPHNTSGTVAAGNFNPAGLAFGFKIDSESSDDTKNKQEQTTGGFGHHVRFFPARDRGGNLIANVYIMSMDYLGINYDYQDNVYLITNIKASNGAGPSPGPIDPGTTPTLAGLSLLNATTDATIGSFGNNTTLDLTGGKTYTVKANPGSNVASVVFAVDGAVIRTETSSPYSAAGENGSDFLAWNVPIGAHTLTATPFAGANGTGNAGTPIVVNFTGDNGSNPGTGFGVSGLTLVNAVTDQDIGPLTNGAVLDMSNGKQYSVRANINGATKSAVFRLDGVAIHTETSLPFSIAGDQNAVAGTNNADYLPWTVASGAHTLNVQGFSLAGGTGTAGTAVTLNITVTNGTTPTPGSGTFTGVNVKAATGSTVSGGANAWIVKGAGNGITGTADEFHFAQQIRSGDFDVKSRLASLTGGAAGMIIRGGTAPGNSEVSLQYAAGGIYFGIRTTFGGNFAIGQVGTGTPGNLWMRLKRVGNTITAFYGTDGVNWTSAGSQSFATFSTAANLGFSVAGGVNNVVTANFNSVAG